MPSVPVPASPQIDATLQMAPLPAGTMKRNCCCTHRNTPLRLILRVCCHLSQESSRSGVPSPPTPAALSAIELAVCVDHRLRHRLDRGRGGDVGLQGERLAAGRLDGMRRFFRALAVRVGHRYPRSLPRKRRRGRAADTGATPGNQRHLAVEPHRAPTCSVRSALARGESG